MSEEQDDETSDNSIMGRTVDPFVLIRVRAKRVIDCWRELTTTTHQRAFGKTDRAIKQLENAIEDYEDERLGQVVGAMTPMQVDAYLEMMGVNTEELEYRAVELRKKLETKKWGEDQIMNKHINEGGTPT